MNLAGDIATDYTVLECPRKIAENANTLPDQPSTVPVHITAAVSVRILHLLDSMWKCLRK